MKQKLDSFNVLSLIRCKCFHLPNSKYTIIETGPATGIIYITEASPYFISGHVRLKGKDQGRYPYNYLEMIDYIFGHEENVIEVCSRGVSNDKDIFTVDINPETNPTVTGDAQYLDSIPDEKFSRWRADPPYSESRALSMYNTDLPSPFKLLAAGARVCKPNSLLFLLLEPQNYQWCPKNVRRIGLVYISVVPNNECQKNRTCLYFCSS